jgi:hypothetical protein
MVIPYNVNTIDSFTVPSVIARGALTSYVIEGCKHMSLQGTVTVYIEDGNVYQLFTKPGTSSANCHTVVQDFIVPSFIIPGEYHLHITITYHPNPFRTVVVEKYSNNFTLK